MSELDFLSFEPDFNSPRVLTAYDELGRLAEAAEVAHLLAAEYPNNVSVQMVLGEILAAQGDVQGALTAYGTAIAAAGPQTMDGERTRDDLRRRMASLQLAQARPEEAMRPIMKWFTPRTFDTRSST